MSFSFGARSPRLAGNYDIDSEVTGQLADATGDCVLSFRSFGGICETASCPVRELAYPRVVQLPSETLA